jgi:hypothetical protein
MTGIWQDANGQLDNELFDAAVYQAVREGMVDTYVRDGERRVRLTDKGRRFVVRVLGRPDVPEVTKLWRQSDSPEGFVLALFSIPGYRVKVLKP